MKRDSGLDEGEIRAMRNALVKEQERAWREDPAVRRKWAKQRWAGCQGHAARFNYCLGINEADVLAICEAGCHYCAWDGPVGIDRIDSTEGYRRGNVVGCCAECNTILGDVPPDVKLLLTPGLQQARDIDFRGWRAPPRRGGKERLDGYGIDVKSADALQRVQQAVLAYRMSKGRRDVKYPRGWSTTGEVKAPEVLYKRRKTDIPDATDTAG